MENELEFEKNWWGGCCNTFAEDSKHYYYAKYMGLTSYWQYFNTQGKSILDIGGGPTSMLLKGRGLKKGKVVDPIEYPAWTKERYALANIEVEVKPGEEVNETGWDEVWIYNCLQHVVDPELIIQNAKRAAPVLRIFEWVNIPPHEGHPHELTKKNLDKWIGQEGTEEYVHQSTIPYTDHGLRGDVYFGEFRF